MSDEDMAVGADLGFGLVDPASMILICDLIDAVEALAVEKKGCATRLQETVLGSEMPVDQAAVFLDQTEVSSDGRNGDQRAPTQQQIGNQRCHDGALRHRVGG